jgi:hypothetical protein
MKNNIKNQIDLARAEGLINGVQGALKHVVVEVAGLSEEEADTTLRKSNEVLDEIRQLIVDVAKNLGEQNG